MGVYLTATKTGGLNYGVSVLVTASGLAGSRAQDREKQDTAAVYNLPATTHKLIISEFLKRFTIFVDLGWRDPFGTKFCEIVRRSDTIQNLEKGPNKQVGSIKIIRGLYKSEIGIGYFWVSTRNDLYLLPRPTGTSPGFWVEFREFSARLELGSKSRTQVAKRRDND